MGIGTAEQVYYTYEAHIFRFMWLATWSVVLGTVGIYILSWFVDVPILSWWFDDHVVSCVPQLRYRHASWYRDYLGWDDTFVEAPSDARWYYRFLYDSTETCVTQFARVTYEHCTSPGYVFGPVCFADAPWLRGVGRWLSYFRVTTLTHVLHPIWGIHIILLLTALVVTSWVLLLVLAGLIRSVFPTLAWLMHGDKVVFHDYAEDIDKISKSRGIDPDLLAYACGVIATKARDQRNLQTLHQSLKSWLGANRKSWSEKKKFDQCCRACRESFAYVKAEDGLLGYFGISSVYAGIVRATEFARGKLLWGRTLPDH